MVGARHLLLLQWISLMLPLLSNAGDLSKYDLKLDVDCGGNDLGSHADKTPSECDDICMANSRCIGFVIHTSTDVCYPKHTACDSTRFSRLDKVDTYTLQREVCTWSLPSTCVYRYNYESDIFEACNWRNWEDQATPWCSFHEVFNTNQWAYCEQSCRDTTKALQYGSQLDLYLRSTYNALDTAPHYTMVYKDPVGESGWITSINMDVGDINRHISIGVFRKIGPGECDFMLVKEVPLFRVDTYKSYLEQYGLQTIYLNSEDYLPVSPYYHFGHYWNLAGTMYYTADSRALGYPMCGYNHADGAPHPFVPYESIDSTSSFHRHYSVDVIVEFSNTDINWLLNAALFKNVASGGTSYSKKDGAVVFTDGDYATCQSVGQDAFIVDLNREVAVSAVKFHSTTDVDLTIRLKDSSGSSEGTSCGSYQGDMAGDFAVVTCSEGARGRYLEIAFSGTAGDVTVCEVEVTLTILGETCIEEQCYFVTSEQVDSPGAADEVCKRRYANARTFEPTDQSHWDSVADWYATLFDVPDATGIHNAVVGIKYTEGSWKLLSSGSKPPTIAYGTMPSFKTYAVMDAVSGEALAEQNGMSHYCLCQVEKSISDASSRVIVRTSAGSDVNLYTLWNSDESTPSLTESFSAALTSLDVTDTDTLVSPLVNCIDWAHVQEIKVSLYKDDMEVAFALFGPGSGKDDWFSMDNMKASSYLDLPVAEESQANFDSVTGSNSGDDKIHWFMNAETFGCENIGWFGVVDSDHSSSCSWSSLGDLTGPQFLYSNRGTASRSWEKADLFVITARLDDEVLGYGLDTCKDMVDGDYHSIIGCNVYVSCVDEVLTYHTCRSGTQFDSDEEECITTSTTCTAGNADQSCQSGCPSVDPCTADQGSCIHPADSTGWMCDCEDGYEGDLCETDINECEGVTCSDRGNCTDLVGDYVCVCDPDSGYGGKDCADDVDECQIEGSCVNGECTNSAGDYSCACEEGYRDTTCTVNIDECEEVDPCDHGHCVDTDGGYNCTCDDGYTGEDCGTDIDECEQTQPCVHGNCTNNEGSYDCDCQQGYTGKNCDEDFDECSTTPCGPGQCTDAFNSYTCDCSGTGFLGDDCDVTDHCFGHTDCTEHGICVNRDSGFTCTCETGYSGDRCQNANLCITERIDCSGNGDCEEVDTSVGWACQCAETHIGDLCELDNPCYPDPCGDNPEGSCQVTSGQDSYFCDCGDFIGDNCDIDHPCVPDPCVHGTCGVTGSPGSYGYVCGCDGHYTGTNCDVHPCDGVNCNNGTCELASEAQEGYVCQCTHPYTGAHCEDDPCMDPPCQNGGKCFLNPQLDSGYECACEWPNEGTNCENDSSVQDSGAVRGSVFVGILAVSCLLALL